MNGFAVLLSLAQDTLRTLTGPSGYGIAIWFLAGVFMWSGITKVRQPALTAMAMVDFGVARRVWPHLGLALGLAEVALATALVVLPQLSVVIAAVLLWIFVLLIARSLQADEHFACFCFGDADSQLSRWTLARTTALALLTTGLTVGTTQTVLSRSIEGNGLEAVAAMGLLGGIALVRRIPHLLHWNSDPLGLRKAART